jgi:GNAT superfamily N-acetyltransferase
MWLGSLIRKATLDETRWIVGVHTADEDLSGLSVRERYLRGGPWMSPETCAIHINALLQEGQLPVVAEVNGRVVGEAEAFFSEELIGGKLTRVVHLDVIEVHPGFRGRGIGRALVEFIERTAREREFELFTVQPSKEAVGFYRKLGFGEVIFDNWLVEVETEGFSAGGVEPLGSFSWGTVRGLELVAGRFQNSYDAWFSSFRDLFAGIHELKEAGKAGNSYYVLKSLPGRPGRASLFLWGYPKDLPGVIGRAKELGVERVLTVLDEETAGYLRGERKGRVQIIAKRLD